tara:strand:- start:10264 stop:10398 length:135 start_codon:yes stop_codon:yes gene_type:complete
MYYLEVNTVRQSLNMLRIIDKGRINKNKGMKKGTFGYGKSIVAL